MKSNKAGLSEERLGYLRSRARRKRLVILARVIILVGFFGLWEIAAQMKWIDSFIMSCPSRMVETLKKSIQFRRPVYTYWGVLP